MKTILKALVAATTATMPALAMADADPTNRGVLDSLTCKAGLHVMKKKEPKELSTAVAFLLAGYSLAQSSDAVPFQTVMAANEAMVKLGCTLEPDRKFVDVLVGGKS